MRLEPIFTLFVLVPALATGIALVPIWGGAQQEDAPALEQTARADLPTGWVSAFVDQLQLPDRQVAVAPDEDPLGSWRIVGVVQGDEGSWVTLTHRGEVRTLTLGEALMGFELVDIDGDEAVFRREGETRALRLQR